MSDSAKPVLIFDGRCGFCGIWIEYWKQLTGTAVDYIASQEAAPLFPQIPKEEFSKSVQLVLPSGEVLSGAHAVFQTLAFQPSRRWMLRLYETLPGFAALTEAAYRLIAAHRSFFYWVTVLLFGRTVNPLRYEGVAWIFRKVLAIIWLIAFASFGSQAAGLIGSHGVQPVSLFLTRVAAALGAGSWRVAPTLFWIQSTDFAIQAVWIAGCICAVLAFFGVFWRGALFLAFVLYLSLVNASQEFLSFQWDILLLETGFLAVFLGYSRVIIWPFRWLLFRLMFLSGAIKLLSGDPTWRNLTALMVHYQTQPIPTPLAWYAQQMPAWFARFSCALVFFIELVIPFLVFAPRRLRLFALPWLVGLQILILLTGNYAFFNWLAIALCLFLLDDSMLPAAWRQRSEKFFIPSRIRRAVAWSVTAVIATLSTLLVIQTLTGHLPAAGASLVSTAAPFSLASSYGLFANMTTTRPEIVIEGSNDGTTWREYEFKYKPGALNRRPPWVAPHQPRLDWQMWFAALGSYQENVWFLNTLARLLQGSEPVLDLLERNPFPGAPPKFIRAQLYEYRFTDWTTRRQTGNWWTRTPLGLYVPALSLEDLSVLPLLKQR